MTNAFSRDYKPSEELSKAISRDIKSARLSTRQAEIRAKRMASPDPQVREQARGHLGKLSAKKGRAK